jgi:hypothetical protein
MLYLASQSPRRRQLLDQIGVPYEAVVVDIDERWDGAEEPAAHVQRLALEKARSAWRHGDGALPVLAADTGVVLDGRLLSRTWTGSLDVSYRDGGSFFSLIVAKYYIRKLIAPLWNRRRRKMLQVSED